MRTQSLSCCSLAASGVLKLSDEKKHKISHDLQFDGGHVVQFHLGVLSSYSYLLCSCDAAMLIDPGRDVNSYEEYLFENHIRLCGVFLTHIHSDFVAGHLEAGERFNVPIFLSRESGASFGHIPLDDDTDFSLGRLKLHFFAAPGHSDEGLCMTVSTRQGKPEMIFTGDALDVSCSDTTGMDWVEKLSKMSDDIRIYPGHEIEDIDKNWTTLGREKQRNRLFNVNAEARNGHALHLETLRQINSKGPELLDWDNLLHPCHVNGSMASPVHPVVDIRNCTSYAQSHIPYSLNIESNGRLEYWTARLFSPPCEVVLTGDNEMDLAEAALRLSSVGCRTKGFLFDDWLESGLPVRSSCCLDAQELDTKMWSDEPPLILDVRSEKEWLKERLPGSINIPLQELEKRMEELPTDREIVLVCASGFRSAVAVGILEGGGFDKLCNLKGGLGAWIEEGKKLNSGREKRVQTPEQSKCGIKS